jgi:hypothetical protein
LIKMVLKDVPFEGLSDGMFYSKEAEKQEN